MTKVHTDDKVLWQLHVKLFGFCNALATFDSLMDTILGDASDAKCLGYLDDIIVVGKTFEDYLQNLRELFEIIRTANLKFNEKSELSQMLLFSWYSESQTEQLFSLKKSGLPIILLNNNKIIMILYQLLHGNLFIQYRVSK